MSSGREELRRGPLPRVRASMRTMPAPTASLSARRTRKANEALANEQDGRLFALPHVVATVSGEGAAHRVGPAALGAP
jgi:hypothetical protein